MQVFLELVSGNWSCMVTLCWPRGLTNITKADDDDDIHVRIFSASGSGWEV